MSSDPTQTFPATQAPPAPPPSTPVTPAPRPARGRDNLLVVVWSLVLAVVVLGPLLASRGVALRGDMVFVPRQELKGAWLGLEGWASGAVPADFLVALGSIVAPGDVLQKAALIAVVVLAATGMGALLSARGLVARLAGATFFVWNPFVYERLLVGDWTFLVGYACLPWIVWAARRVTTGSLGEVAPVIAFIALAGWTSPMGGFLALVLAVVVIARRGGRAALTVLLAGIVVNLVWIVPGIFRPGGATGASERAEALAATAETPLGLVGSLLTLGGIWDADAYAPGRDQTIVVILALVVTLAALAGITLASRHWDAGAVGGVTVVAVIGLVVAVLGGLEATQSVIEGLVDSVPGGEVFADGHAWLAPLALLLAIGFGVLAGTGAELARQRAGAPLAALTGVVAVAIPVALLPGLALAADGELDDIRYPGDWWTVRELLRERDPSGTLVLPFAAERSYDWNDGRTSADPARQYFTGDVIADDQRVVNGVTIPGTDPRAAAVREALGGSGDEFLAVLAEQGIDTVVIERNVTGTAAPQVQLGERLHRGGELVVFAVDGAAGTAPDDDTPDIAVIVADVLAALAGVGALVLWIGAGRRRRVEV